MQQRYAQWKIASLYLSPWQNNRLENTAPEIVPKEHSVSVTFKYIMPTSPVSECRVTYEVFGDGTVETTLKYDPVKELGDMPEFGMIFKLDADHDKLTWYGLGPEESYEDRKKGGRLGIYSADVSDGMSEYLVPQECGNRCGVRYARVTDHKGCGIMFEGDEMSLSALPYTPHELENAAHPYELPPVYYTVVRVAMKQMGIGGDDSWGAKVHPEYLIDVSRPLEFRFRFRGI
jgi:beta-galactosidase